MYRDPEYKENCRMILENRLGEDDLHCPSCEGEALGCSRAKADGNEGIVYCCACWAKFRYKMTSIKGKG